MSEFSEGTVIAGRYRIRGVLGRGAMGDVHRAEQLDADGEPLREVALKTVRPEFSSDADFAKRFLREVRVAARLRSPHVVVVHDSGRSADGSLFYSMELVSGVTLRDVLRREGALGVQRAVRVVGQICSALAEAHQPPHPVIHRDLKPPNIFVEERDGEDWVKVADFGIAKFIGVETTGLTRVGESPGTPRYMAPEQWGNQALDARADLYALGVIFYELLVGVPPFVGDQFQLMAQHLNEESPALPDAIPPGIRQVVGKLLAKTPADRYESAAAVTKALREALASGLPAGGEHPVEPTIVLAKAGAAEPVPSAVDSAVAQGSRPHSDPTPDSPPAPANPEPTTTEYLLHDEETPLVDRGLAVLRPRLVDADRQTPAPASKPAAEAQLGDGDTRAAVDREPSLLLEAGILAIFLVGFVIAILAGMLGP